MVAKKLDQLYLSADVSPPVDIHVLTENVSQNQRKYENQFNYLHHWKRCVTLSKTWSL